ncbi:hypothetical protein GCM10010221_01200 [Streptomyces parvus]|nr:hypothetical protein GCM10010221_01200 [Streptomyces parvus]
MAPRRADVRRRTAGERPWGQPKQPTGDRGTHQKGGYPARPGLRTLPAAGRTGPGAMTAGPGRAGRSFRHEEPAAPPTAPRTTPDPAAAHDEALDRETPAERLSDPTLS